MMRLGLILALVFAGTFIAITAPRVAEAAPNPYPFPGGLLAQACPQGAGWVQIDVLANGVADDSFKLVTNHGDCLRLVRNYETFTDQSGNPVTVVAVNCVLNPEVPQALVDEFRALGGVLCLPPPV